MVNTSQSKTQMLVFDITFIYGLSVQGQEHLQRGGEPCGGPPRCGEPRSAVISRRGRGCEPDGAPPADALADLLLCPRVLVVLLLALPYGANPCALLV